MIVPLELVEGERYTELARKEDEMDHIYKLNLKDEDWINPKSDDMPCWEKHNECISDSNEELEDWENQLQEVSMMRYLRITRYFWYISSKVGELPCFDGSGSIKEFFRTFKAKVPRERRLRALNRAMHAMPLNWWDTHKGVF